MPCYTGKPPLPVWIVAILRVSARRANAPVPLCLPEPDSNRVSRGIEPRAPNLSPPPLAIGTNNQPSRPVSPHPFLTDAELVETLERTGPHGPAGNRTLVRNDTCNCVNERFPSSRRGPTGSDRLID